MAKDETTASKRPSAGSGSARSCPTSSTRPSSAKRSRAAYQHRLGEIEAHAEHLAAVDPEEGEQPPVARPKVEDAPGVAGHLLEQDALSLCAVRIGVGPGEVAQRVFRGRPFLGGHARILAARNPAGRVRRNTLVAPFWSYR